MLAAALAIAVLAAPAAGDLDLVSRANGASGASGNGSSQLPTASADGGIVAFTSAATNLTGDAASGTQAYVRDLGAGTTTLASRADGASGAPANAGVASVSTDDDGGRVVFQTRATNLGPAAANVDRVFLRDGTTTTLISDNALTPVISADGSTVAFASTNNIAGTGATGASLKIFAYDVASGAYRLVSRGANGLAFTGADPSISDDGRSIAFSGQGGTAQVWVRDSQASAAVLVSRESGTDGPQANTAAIEPDISGNGRYVVFRSAASNLSDVDAENTDDIFERDLQTGTTTLVSRADGATGAAADNDCDLPQVSDDGARVLFRSRATNLSGEDNSNGDNAFVRDTVTGTTTWVHGRAGQSPPPQGVMNGLAMAGDGRYAIFASNATLLPGEETGSFSDVFRRDLGGAAPPPPLPAVSIDATASAREGGPGTTTPVTLAVHLSAADPRTISVDWATADGTATSGDYRAAHGQVTFQPGQTTQYVSVDVLGDGDYEGDETFSVHLSNPVNATLGAAAATVTIANDDAQPTPTPTGIVVPPPPPGPAGLPATSGAPATTCATQLTQGPAVLHGCFVDGRATGIVSLNGLTIDTQGGAVDVSPAKIVSTKPVVLSAGDVVIFRGTLDVDLKTGTATFAVPSGATFYGMQLQSHMAVTLASGGVANVAGYAGLPIGGSLQLRFTTSEGDGLRRGSLVASTDVAYAGAIPLYSVKFTFDPAGRVWHGGLTITAPWSDSTSMPLTGTLDTRGNVVLTGNGLGFPKFLKIRTATVSFLQSPVGLKGALGFDFLGDVFTYDGAFSLDYASHAFALNGTAKVLGITLGQPGSLIQLAAKLAPKVGGAGGALGAMTGSSPITVSSTSSQTPGTLASLLGKGNALTSNAVKWAIDLYTGHLTGEGQGSFQVLGVTVGGSYAISEKGFAACGQVGPVQAGFGIHVNPFSLQLMGPFVCDVGPWRTTAVASQAGGTRTVTLGDGPQVLRLHGAGDMTLSGPGGQAISTAGPSRVSPSLAVLKDTDTTYVAIKQAKGTWTIAGAAGVDSASVLPPVKVTARVSSDAIRWTEKVSPGQTVTLAEQSGSLYHELGTLHGARGTLHFTPMPGGGRRDIVATVVQGGLPMSKRVIAHYTPPKPPKPGRPGKVKVKPAGAKLTVTWKAARDASAYRVTAKTPNGTLYAQVKGTRAVLTDIAPVRHATVTVAAVGGASRKTSV